MSAAASGGAIDTLRNFCIGKFLLDAKFLNCYYTTTAKIIAGAVRIFLMQKNRSTLEGGNIL